MSDGFDSPDGRTYSGPVNAATPGQAAQEFTAWAEAQGIGRGDLYGWATMADVFAAGRRAAITAQDARPAPGRHPLGGLIANSYALYKFAQDGEWLTCEDDGRLDMRKELLAVKAAVREALKPVTEPKAAPELAAAEVLAEVLAWLEDPAITRPGPAALKDWRERAGMEES